MELLTFLLILLLIIVIIPLAIYYLFYRIIKHRGYNNLLSLLAIIPSFILGLIIYNSTYPSSEFYVNDFKEITKMSFPKNGIIKYKTASFQDNVDDYTSAFLIELDQTSLMRLEIQLKKEKFELEQNRIHTQELDYIEKKKGDISYIKQFIRKGKNGLHYSVSFLNDNKSVIITRMSW